MKNYQFEIFFESLKRAQQGREYTKMPDPTNRKRLKKRMLDRWENEGGRLADDSTSAEETRQSSEPKGQAKRLSSSRKSAVVVPASRTKGRKSTGK